jgi:hypothetical protein
MYELLFDVVGLVSKSTEFRLYRTPSFFKNDPRVEEVTLTPMKVPAGKLDATVPSIALITVKTLPSLFEHSSISTLVPVSRVTKKYCPAEGEGKLLASSRVILVSRGVIGCDIVVLALFAKSCCLKVMFKPSVYRPVYLR